MQDPSVRLDNIVKQCTKPKDRVGTEKGETALGDSIDVLQRLKDDGCDLIGSVESSSVVRTDRLLTQRNATEVECTALAESSSGHVEVVESKLKTAWTTAFTTTAPHQLTVEIDRVKELSGDILSTQQDLINRLRDEVNRAEQTIQQEIERQTDDLGVMRKRMKDHLDSTRATQRCQLRDIDTAFGEDYEYLLGDHANQMDQMLAEWSAIENQILGEMNEIGDEWATDLTATDTHYYNECSRTRNVLTDDIQLIERELEKLKASFMLNNEVLDYNCRVLKLREEERSGLILGYKRKINRLADRYRQLKEESDKAKQTRRQEELKLIKEIQQLKLDCLTMERKFSTIKTANDRQLESVCQLAEERINQLLKKLASIDERIFVEILEQPCDGLVGISHDSEPLTPKLGPREVEEEIDRLEKHLQYLMNDRVVPIGGSTKEKLMKVLDIPDETEFGVLLTTMRSVMDRDLVKELSSFIHHQQSRPADQPVTSRRYLMDAGTIRSHFSRFKETAMPKKRMDMWKMLARALIQYERILRDRLTVAADILTLTK